MLQEFARYAATPNYEKAFVIGANSRFTWVSGRKTSEDAVADAGLALPLLETIRERLEEGEDAYGDADMSATYLTSAPAP